MSNPAITIDPASDPYTRCYQTIYNAIAAWMPKVNSPLKVGSANMPDLSSKDFTRFKTAIEAGDTPELIILQGKWQDMPFGSNSLISTVTQNYPIIVTHSNLVVTPMNALKWELGRALLAAGDTLGLNFVRGWALIESVDDPFGKVEWTRDTFRWTSLAQINVEMYFDRRRRNNLN